MDQETKPAEEVENHILLSRTRRAVIKQSQGMSTWAWRGLSDLCSGGNRDPGKVCVCTMLSQNWLIHNALSKLSLRIWLMRSNSGLMRSNWICCWTHAQTWRTNSIHWKTLEFCIPAPGALPSIGLVCALVRHTGEYGSCSERRTIVGGQSFPCTEALDARIQVWSGGYV